jgi:ribulose-5-phosphate 4-epimerase/fuculose-1-phosphate aldolase
MEAIERELRIQLAAVYRLVHHFGWDELIWTHSTVRLPGPEDHFLINPYGFRFDEVTASNLVKVDADGRILGDPNQEINPAGFVIHSAIHRMRPDVRCILHTHTVAGMAVAALDCGLLPPITISRVPLSTSTNAAGLAPTWGTGMCSCCAITVCSPVARR